MEELHLVVPELDQLITAIKQELGIFTRMECGSFLSPKGSGYSIHSDNQPDTFIVQTSGIKRWKYSEYPAAPNPIIRTVIRPGEAMEMDPWASYRAPIEDDLKISELSVGDIPLANDQSGPQLEDVIAKRISELTEHVNCLDPS